VAGILFNQKGKKVASESVRRPHENKEGRKRVFGVANTKKRRQKDSFIAERGKSRGDTKKSDPWNHPKNGSPYERSGRRRLVDQGRRRGIQAEGQKGNNEIGTSLSWKGIRFSSNCARDGKRGGKKRGKEISSEKIEGEESPKRRKKARSSFDWCGSKGRKSAPSRVPKGKKALFKDSREGRCSLIRASV